MTGKVLPIAFFSVLLAAGSCRQRTEEAIVLEVIDALTRLAEQRNLEGMMVRIAADFTDFEGRDREALHSLLSSYLGSRTGIVARRLSRRIIRIEDGQAQIEMDVALSSGGAAALRRLVPVTPDIYRIRIDLEKHAEDWQVSYAEWSWISLTDLLPESLSALKKLFPRI